MVLLVSMSGDSAVTLTDSLTPPIFSAELMLSVLAEQQDDVGNLVGLESGQLVLHAVAAGLQIEDPVDAVGASDERVDLARFLVR